MVKNGGFADFVFRQHRWILWSAVAVLLLHFGLIRMRYPHAISLGDSWFYVKAAAENYDIDIRPIGYPKFLRLIHFFSKSDLAVVAVQYFLLEAAILFFYFTALYLLRPGRWIGILILCCLVMNPFILCFNNYILSDSIFTALTVLWFTLMLWYIYRPRPVLVYCIVVLLWLLFAIRYYSIFYPVITLPVILFSRISWRIKLSGLVLGCLLFLGYIRYTASEYEKLIGRREFSPFSGWQLAANALLMYRHLSDRDLDLPPESLQPLHQFVLHQLDTMPSPEVVPDRMLKIFFMWDARSPLQMYLTQQFQDRLAIYNLQEWASMAKLYHDYGTYLIKRHPFAFVRYYMVQGIDWFIHPSQEFPNTFEEGGFEVNDEVKNWFGYKSNWVSCKPGKLYSITAFPTIVNILNLLMIIGTIGFCFCRCYRTASPMVNRAIALAAVYWMINFLFIITSAAMMLRYALPITIFDIVFVPVLITHIYQLGRSPKVITSPTAIRPAD